MIHCEKRCKTNSGSSRYNPDEPRIPAGQPGGGQWTTGGGVSSDSGSISADDARSTLTDRFNNPSTLSPGVEVAGNNVAPTSNSPAQSWYDQNFTWLISAALAIGLIIPVVGETELGAGGVALVGGTATTTTGAATATVGAAAATEAAISATADGTGGAAADAMELELGTDTASGQFRQGEADTAKLLQDRLGITLQRSSDKAYDWVDAEGITYDAVGPAPSEYFNADSFNKAIDDHLLTQGLDKVPVNIINLTADQQAAVEAHISKLSVKDQVRIILLK